MKTTIFAALCAVALSGSAVAQSALPKMFADCAGRFSAHKEHAWLMQTARGAHFATGQTTFASLVEASSAEGAERALMHHRIAAKYAQARLLQAATFKQDKAQAALAARLAEGHIARCENLLLGG